ncbi:PadR family transcriptional regulator [Gordonia sp. HNM0687]|uniref:PadR family transcriptional regulator n=1 Tax=Gordonia mangrovi TaxID=2665643 RepID=A0A6L7GVX1_9ACTN|nr:PadR family transcriptional regulator [Gordonia mangrovi]MXP23181.1 PadR family transcriptional regulator [Gordonia mangrovi]UVF77455.1 PadR family transcriptional regulator [Gordonia mangrovi]
MSANGTLPPLAVLVLGLVAERPMHPYEMFQTTIERREDRLVKFRPGTLYHTVDRLAGKELIEVHDVEREGNRPERTIYRITAGGRAALARSLEELLAGHPTEYPQLYLALSEAHGLPRARVIELLATRLTQMRAELQTLRAGAADADAAGKAEMFYLDIGCRITTLVAQIGWLDDLVKRLTTHTIAWLDDPDFRAAAVPTGLHEKDTKA